MSVGDKTHGLEVHQRQLHSAVVVTVLGEIDMTSAPQLQSAIEEAQGNEPPLLILDLSGVRFFGSAGLSVLIVASRAAPKDGLRVVASPQVRRPIEVTALDSLLDVFGTLEDALEPPRIV